RIILPVLWLDPEDGEDVGFRRDVDADELHGASRADGPEASEPVLVPLLVHARMTAPIRAVIRPLAATPPDTVRAKSTGRGRQSHCRRGVIVESDTVGEIGEGL
ncbi:hypothetical protein, partial [Azospirillum oleiclasticum]|uniref:hypothetical protein n=1 Tax=Azospirillum oleiclasticum TaxID=2735135 RepID=UPI001B3BE33F